MYPWLVYLHVIGIFSFLMAHGVSVGVALKLRSEWKTDRIRLLLDLSRNAVVVVDISLLLLLVTGISAAFAAHWWTHGWIWISLALLIVLIIGMEVIGVRRFNQIRLMIGLPSTRGQTPDQGAMVPEEIQAEQIGSWPVWLAVIGFGGLAIITWLMIFKPF